MDSSAEENVHKLDKSQTQGDRLQSGRHRERFGRWSCPHQTVGSAVTWEIHWEVYRLHN